MTSEQALEPEEEGKACTGVKHRKQYIRTKRNTDRPPHVLLFAARGGLFMSGLKPRKTLKQVRSVLPGGMDFCRRVFGTDGIQLQPPPSQLSV
jgi:hypothetical protein